MKPRLRKCWSSLKSTRNGDTVSNSELTKKDLQLLYTLFCDDVRLEAGNKLSFMGVFQNMMVQQLPLSLIKFAVVNHWQGSGSYLSEVRSEERRVGKECRSRWAAYQ